MPRWKKLLGSLAVAGLVVGAGLGWYFYSWWTTPLDLDNELVVEIAPGQTVGHLGAQLVAGGAPTTVYRMRWIAVLTGQGRAIQSGEYRVERHDSPQSILRRMVDGDVIAYGFRIIEGMRVFDVLADLKATPNLNHALASVDAQSLMTELGEATRHAEGWLFPDTYHFVGGDTDRSLVMRAYRKMQTELNGAWTGRDAGLPYASPYEMLIVASLIEKETGLESDRADISQVFVSRLHQGMRLQTDPSVIYGLGSSFDGNLTRAHLRQNTEYNTYVHNGLPPTPIALPGRASLLAAAHPSASDYLYFVARGDGSSQFSATLEEHLAAVRKYQLD